MKNENRAAMYIGVCLVVPMYIGIAAAGAFATQDGQDGKVSPLSLKGEVTTPLQRFLEDIKERNDVSQQTRAFIADKWQACKDCDAKGFLIESLGLIRPAFREGLDAMDAGDNTRGYEIMSRLASDVNPFVSANAAVYAVKALVGQEDFEKALKEINALTGDATKEKIILYTDLEAEVDFLRGYCLLENLHFDDAALALDQFLKTHPDASERLIASTRQMLAEIHNRRTGRIGEVSDLMNYAAKRLRLADSGRQVQTQQQRAVELLEKLVKEAQQREQNSSQAGAAGGNNGNNPNPNTPRNPMRDSQLPSGPAKASENLHTQQANPGEAWGAMPPAQRQRILQALGESFPGRYRQLVEQYYEQLAKEP